MTKRVEKVAEAVHEMVSELLVKGLKDPRIGFVTITGVEMTDDLHLAKVYFTVIGTEEEKKATAAGLNSARGFIRKEMGKKFHMRYIPNIIFSFDRSSEYGARIDCLLQEIGPTDEHDDSQHT